MSRPTAARASTTESLSDLTPPAFSGAELDRVGELREDPDWVAAQLRVPGSRALGATSDAVLVTTPPRSLKRFAVPAELSAQDAVLLGLDRGTALFGLDLEPPGLQPPGLEPPGLQPPGLEPAARLPTDGELISLREAGAELPRPEAGLAAYLAALMHWHRRHRFCANCGAPTAIREAGYSRHCQSCGASHFPRTDPVVIMLVAHAGHLLLGRRGGWPAGRYSVLAGFVSPGESLEEAVIREVREESGIEARNPRFVTSQPWPFPSSLMLGFEADSPGGEPVARDGELEDVGWFSAETVRAAAQTEVANWAEGPSDGTALALPPRLSIARFLIDRWLRTGA